jgi:hypothetical protein
MLKVFTATAAFVLTFGVSVSLVGLLFGFDNLASPSFETGNSQSVKHRVTAFLEMDVRNGKIRDIKIRKYFRAQRAEGLAPRTEEYYRLIDEYVDASSSMNDSFLPEDLQYAWRDHMKAWNNERALLAEAARGELNAEHFKVRADENSKEITATWFQVLRIADRYGVYTGDMK